MPTPEVIEKVRQLHAELEEQPDAPDLESLRKQIDTVLVEPFHAPHYHGLRDKLLFAYVGFEIDHPKIASTMQSVINSLTVAGL